MDADDANNITLCLAFLILGMVIGGAVMSFDYANISELNVAKYKIVEALSENATLSDKAFIIENICNNVSYSDRCKSEMWDTLIEKVLK